MNTLLTGAFGNIGVSTLEELLKRCHHVQCFDVKTKGNEKTARKNRKEVEIIWGDLRNPDEVFSAVKDQNVVVHLAFVIP